MVERVDVRDDRQLLDEAAVALLGLSQQRLGALEVIDVLDHRDDVPRRSPAAPQAGRVDPTPDDGAVPPQEALLEPVALTLPGQQVSNSSRLPATSSG